MLLTEKLDQGSSLMYGSIGMAKQPDSRVKGTSLMEGFYFKYVLLRGLASEATRQLMSFLTRYILEQITRSARLCM